jgi:hypothetical protein
MDCAEVLDIGRSAIWLTLQLCAPVLIVGLVVGVAKVIGLSSTAGKKLPAVHSSRQPRVKCDSRYGDL